MKKNHSLLVSIFCMFYTYNVAAQKGKIIIGFNINPAVVFSFKATEVFVENKKTNSLQKRNPNIFWGAGFDFLQPIGSNNFILLDLSFLYKGDYAYDSKSYTSSGNFLASSSSFVEMGYLQTTLAFQKIFTQSKPKHFFKTSVGLFYGIHSDKVGHQLGNWIELGDNNKYNGEFGNDFGVAIAAGIQVRRFTIKSNFEKGLIRYKNINSKNFTTTIVGLKFGYQLSKIN